MGGHISRLARQLEDLIRKEEERIVQSFPAKMERRLALMEIARAMDYYWVRRHFGLLEGEDAFETASLMEFGLNKAVTLFLDRSTKAYGFPLMCSPRHLQQWADSVLQHCGRLGQCEYLLDQYRCGLVELEQASPTSSA